MVNVTWAKWSVEDVGMLKFFVEQGLSALQISKKFDERFGKPYSRSAIIGRCRRLNLQLHGVQPLRGPRKGKPKKRAATASARIFFRARHSPSPPLAPEQPIELPSQHLTLLEMCACDGCRWPYGDGPFTFCGNPRMKQPWLDPGSRTFYCTEHLEMSTRGGSEH